MKNESQQKYGDLSKLAKVLASKTGTEGVDYKKGDIWQSILNLGYERWRSADDWKYYDMIAWMKVEYGEFPALCILLGKYNYQVENGGHVQYYDNGFASVGRGKGMHFGGCNSSEIEIHDWMVKYFKKFELQSSELGKELLGILADFSIEVDDDEDGWHDFYRVVDAEYLDKRYYKIKQAWVDHFSSLVRDAVQDFAEAA